METQTNEAEKNTFFKMKYFMFVLLVGLMLFLPAKSKQGSIERDYNIERVKEHEEMKRLEAIRIEREAEELRVKNEREEKELERMMIIKARLDLNLNKSTWIYLRHLAIRESSNRWNVVSIKGYAGKFQFGNAALKDVGRSDITYRKFKANPSIWPEHEQDIAMVKLLRRNKRILKYYITKYNKTTFNDIYVTESGMLAAAHLSGAYGVKKYFKTNGKYNPKDPLGTSLSDYLRDFSGYYVKL